MERKEGGKVARREGGEAGRWRGGKVARRKGGEAGWKGTASFPYKGGEE